MKHYQFCITTNNQIQKFKEYEKNNKNKTTKNEESRGLLFKECVITTAAQRLYNQQSELWTAMELWIFGYLEQNFVHWIKLKLV